MKLLSYLSICLSFLLIPTTIRAESYGPVVKTTSGSVRGLSVDRVFTFKGIRYGEAPTGNLRWEPPQPFHSNNTLNATTFSPACPQQFVFAAQNITLPLLNNPAPTESEDCLFLNVWAPADTSTLKPVMVWIHGGGLTSGTSSTSAYDGTSLANQGIIVVTFNYRTNVFGFPQSEELFPNRTNLGFMDQELALQWVQQNIAHFGGDKAKVTIQGESAGSQSVAYMLQRHSSHPPFRAAIMQSGAATSQPTIPNFTPFDAMAPAVGCNQTKGKARLACLRAVPAEKIHAWTNGPSGIGFGPLVDNVTLFSNPIQRISQKKTARVPIIIGSNQDEGSLTRLFLDALGISFADFLNSTFGGLVSVEQVRALYPQQNDSKLLENVVRELIFLCPAELTAGAYVDSGMPNTFRYAYGPVFSDLQVFPEAGAWHGSEVQEVFGTFNTTTASADEITLSSTIQTMWANFIKDPTSSPGPNWEKFVPGNNTNGLAKLAYHGNVQLNNVVDPVPGDTNDGPCNAIWNQFLTP